MPLVYITFFDPEVTVKRVIKQSTIVLLNTQTFKRSPFLALALSVDTSPAVHALWVEENQQQPLYHWHHWSVYPSPPLLLALYFGMALPKQSEHPVQGIRDFIQTQLTIKIFPYYIKRTAWQTEKNQVIRIVWMQLYENHCGMIPYCVQCSYCVV